MLTISQHPTPITQHLGLGINEFKVHGGIIGTGSLVDVDIKTASFSVYIHGIALHLERGLHACLREDSHRGIAPVDGLLHAVADLRKLAFLSLLLLSVVVARQPPGGVIASHCKLGALLLDEEVIELLLLGELVAEADTIIVDAETDPDFALCGLLL